MSRKVSYTAVVLSESDQRLILDRMTSLFYNYLKPIGFEMTSRGELLAHHMTTNLGPCCANRDFLGQKVELTIDAWGMNDKALAVRVTAHRTVTGDAVHCVNEQPHITVAINPTEGGKPMHSNDITTWTKFPTPFIVLGVLQEV